MIKLEKLGPSLTRLFIGSDKSIWFSYETPIGYQNGNCRITRVNELGATTGKHLNLIDGGKKNERLAGPFFLTCLKSNFPGLS